MYHVKIFKSLKKVVVFSELTAAIDGFLVSPAGG